MMTLYKKKEDRGELTKDKMQVSKLEVWLGVAHYPQLLLILKIVSIKLYNLGSDDHSNEKCHTYQNINSYL